MTSIKHTSPGSQVHQSQYTKVKQTESQKSLNFPKYIHGASGEEMWPTTNWQILEYHILM